MADRQTILARHYLTGRPIRLILDGGYIAAVEPSEEAADLWVSPGFWDLQFNGGGGVSFSDPGLTVEQVREAVLAQTEHGSVRVLPTLITASREATSHGLKMIKAACEADDIGHLVESIHLEGPYISELDGYRGAHPVEHVRDPDPLEYEAWCDYAVPFSWGPILITLAPERPGAVEFIRAINEGNVVIALGHTAADGPTFRAAAAAGARLSTHLGNGIAADLPRHPNPIWQQAAMDDLYASFIADGHHVDADTLRALIRAKTPARSILVSDASPLAGLPPGRYGEWEVEPSGRIVVAGTPYLAGANYGLDDGVDFLLREVGLSLAEAIATVTANPVRLLGKHERCVHPGETADLVLFRLNAPGSPRVFELVETIVAGRRQPVTGRGKASAASGA